MSKLTVENLAPYLPYKLRVQSFYNNRIERLIGIVQYRDHFEVQTVSSDSDNPVVWYWKDAENDFKPYLRPLDQLTQEIEHPNGYRFIPAIELSRYVDNGHNHTDSKVKRYSDKIIVSTDKCDDIHNVSFNTSGLPHIKIDSDNVSFATCLRIYNDLLKYHFDVFGLIKAGLALPITN